MTDGITKDVIVNSDEWIALVNQLIKKDIAVKDMLDKFITALDTLTKDGFVKGTRCDNMKALRNDLCTLRKQLDGISESTKSTIEAFYKGIEFVDKYFSFSWL